MPLPGARYRMKKTKKGLMRLAFVDGKVVEVKNMTTGAVETPKEIKAETKKRKKVKKKGKK